MTEPVAAILHWDADEDAALERYERAVTAWREKFSGQSAGPLHAIAGRSERGGLVVVNVFPTDEDHLAFGRNMGDPLAAVGLPRPTSNTCRSAASAGRSLPMATTTRARSRRRDAPVMHVSLLGNGKAPQNGAFL